MWDLIWERTREVIPPNIPFSQTNLRSSHPYGTLNISHPHRSMGNIEEKCLIVKDNSFFSSWPEICWARVGTLGVFKNHSIEK